MARNRTQYQIDLEILDQLNAISRSMLDTRGLCIIMNQYFDESKKTEQEPLRDYYGVLNEEIIDRLFQLINGLNNIVDKIQFK